MGGNGKVDVADVLEVVNDFEPFEPAGVSTGLVAWELHSPEPAIDRLVEQAVQAGLLERAGVDHRSGQALWRLTDNGRDALAAS
jgi:hypothetical protein